VNARIPKFRRRAWGSWEDVRRAIKQRYDDKWREKRENVLDEKCVVKKVTNETNSEQIFLLGEKGEILWEMDHGAPFFFFFMDHKHREETPILRECQEFSRELLAFATAAAQHARVRGSVTFLLSCGACSIAPIRARDLLRQFITARGR